MRAPALLALALAAASSGAAMLDFDDAEALLRDGSNAATASVLDARYPGVNLAYYRFVDPLDPANSDPYVPVTAASYADYPNLAPGSGPNALDGFDGSLIAGLDSALAASFGIDVIRNRNSTGGNVGDPNARVLVFDAAGAQIDSVALDTSAPGRFTYAAKPFATIMLPSGAYYDGLAINPVPEPATLAALAAGAVALRRRRR